MDIKTWFAKKDTGETVITSEATIAPIVKVGFDREFFEIIPRTMADQIAEKFLEIHGESLKRKILDNPNFADSVYNAIVLKKAEKL